MKYEVTVTEKICSQCNVLKPASAFRLDTRLKSGLKSYGKECYNNKRRIRNNVPDLTLEKPCKICKVRKGLSEYPLDKRMDDGVTNICRMCDRPRRQRYSEKTRDKRKSYRENNRERISAYLKRWHINNREYVAERGRLYRIENSERLRARSKEYQRVNKEKLRPAKAEASNRRRCRLRASYPRWANRDKILEIYKERERISKETGIVHHVDHIVPLGGKSVCGLHVEYNFRIIPKQENLAKAAKFDDQILNESIKTNGLPI